MNCVFNVKKVCLLILVGLIFISACGCTNEKETETTYTKNDPDLANSIDFIPETTLKEITLNGLVSIDSFSIPENTICLDIEENNKLFPFSYKNKFGYADADGNVVIPEKYKRAYCYSNGKALVQTEDGTFQIIDTTDKILFELPNDIKYIPYGRNLFTNNQFFAAIPTDLGSDEYNLIFIDKNLKMEINSCKISGNRSLINDSQFVGFMTWNPNFPNNPIEVKEMSDEVLFSLSYEKFKEAADLFPGGYNYQTTPANILFVNEGKINVFDENGLWGVCDINNKNTVIDYQYDYVGKWNKKAIPVCKYNKWGIIDGTGKQVCDFKFKYISNFIEGKAIAIDLNDKLCFINTNGELIASLDSTSISYDGISLISFTKSGIALISTKHGYENYLINERGNILMRCSSTTTIDYLSNKYVLANDRLYEIIEK